MNYRAAPGISGTQMAKLYINPELYFFEQDPANAQFVKRESTPAMQFGTAVHLAILEPSEFQRRSIVLRHVDNYATKEGIAAKKEVQDQIVQRELSDPLVLKPIELASIERMAASFQKEWVRFNDLNFDLLGNWDGALKEAAWYDVIDGIAVKGQLDILTTTNIVCDIKTTSNLEMFSREIESRGYDVQLTHYAKLANAKPQIVFFALESIPSFRCLTYQRCTAEDKWDEAWARL